MTDLNQILIAVSIGLLWGITNPFLETGAKVVDKKETEKKSKNFIVKGVWFLWSLIANYQFLIPFLINQLGSVLFYYALGNSSSFI